MSASPIKKRIQEYLFDQAPMAIAVIDRDFNVVEANELFEAAYGAWKGRKCYEVYKKSRTRCAKCPAREAFEDGQVHISEQRGESKEGDPTHYRVRIFPIRDEKGDIPYVVEMSSDITERVAMWKEYQTLYDNVPCYITVLDRDLRIVKSNALFDRKFGREGKKYCYEMYKGSGRPCKDCPSMKVFETGETSSALQVGVDKDGNESHYMVTTAPLKRDHDGVSQVIEISQDISEMLELKDKLKKSEHDLVEAERLAAVGQTVAGLAHGIKNVTMGLEGGMYVVNSGLKRDDKALVKQGWVMLEDNIARISSFVLEFLSFAKGSEPKITPVAPVAIAGEVAALFRGKAEKDGVKLVEEYPVEVAEAPMDREGIHAALSNLVSNAVDACLYSDKKDMKVTLVCSEKEGTILYKVRDNGGGMDYEVKKKIFTNFFTTKGSGHGTGLGLLLTRKIVSQHGGKISFTSREGEGSEFVLEFPRRKLPKSKG